MIETKSYLWGKNNKTQADAIMRILTDGRHPTEQYKLFKAGKTPGKYIIEVKNDAGRVLCFV